MSEPVELVLVEDLATEPKIADRNEIEYMLFSILRASTENPDTLRSHLYASIYDHLMQNPGVTIMQAAKYCSLRLNVSIGGRGRRDLIYAEQVRKGIPVSMGREISPPGLMDKLLNRDKVRAYEQQEAERLGLE